MAGYYVFFRCWPGFTEPFPFDRFNALPDPELATALDTFAREQLGLPEVTERIKREARSRRGRYIEGVKAESGKRLGIGSMGAGHRRTHHESAQDRWHAVRRSERKDPLVCRLGAYLGWWHSGIIGQEGPMPRTWFHETNSREFAEQLVGDLDARSKLDYDTHEPEYYCNPRSGFISAEGLSDGQRASIRRCISAIREGTEPAVEGAKLALLIGQRAIQVAQELSKAWLDDDRSGFEIPEEAIPPELGKRRSFDGDTNGGPPSQPVLTITTWEELGIGIDEGSYFGISPPPDFGAVFPKEKATKLDLPGDQWEKLLDLLAKSKDGNSAKKEDVMIAFGYLQRGKYNQEELEELSGNGKAMRELDNARKRLTGACGDLGRKLKEKVLVVTPGAAAILSVAEKSVVTARFTVRYLLRGSDGKLRFGGAE